MAAARSPVLTGVANETGPPGYQTEGRDRKEEITMMKKLMLLGAGAVGYVLGARAGRERYDQIAEQAQKLRTNPKVQEKVALVQGA